MSLPGGVVERYESLREQVLQTSRGADQGWALLMRCGLLDWAQVSEPHLPKGRIASLDLPVVVIPDGLSLSLIQLLAGMVLHFQHEVASSV